MFIPEVRVESYLYIEVRLLSLATAIMQVPKSLGIRVWLQPESCHAGVKKEGGGIA